MRKREPLSRRSHSIVGLEVTCLTPDDILQMNKNLSLNETPPTRSAMADIGTQEGETRTKLEKAMNEAAKEVSL